MPRSTKFTPDRQQAFLQGAALGVPRKLCAQAAGWSEAVAYEYLARARNAQERAAAGQRLTPTERQYVAFLEDVEKAEATHAQACMAVVINAARQNTWQAAAWALERRWPEQFGRRWVEVSGPGGSPLTVEVTADQLLSQLRELTGSSGGTNGNGNGTNGRRLRALPPGDNGG